MRAFLTPRWLALHVLLVVSLVVLALTGMWQWDRAGSGSGSWQNYGYAVQWWLFGGFAVFLWVKTVLDELDPARTGPDEAADELPPVVQRQAPPPAEDDDDELAAYNRYLRSLHEKQP